MMTEQAPERVDVRVIELLPGLMNRVLRLIGQGGYSEPKTLPLPQYIAKRLSLKTGSIFRQQRMSFGQKEPAHWYKVL